MNNAPQTCVIFGGAGYIGRSWAIRLARRKRFQRIILADLRPPDCAVADQVDYIPCDVRKAVEPRLPDIRPDWIFNFAAVHREPGHSREEYFDTNVAGARNVCAFAEQVGCKNMFFTSSIAVYGPTKGPTSESTALHPISPYGISKLEAERIHEGWRNRDSQRRLLICRPAVVYGPGDPGNILRMIRAVKKGYFVFPGSRHLRKSYAYVEGLLESFEFIMQRGKDSLIYNYAERETETLEDLVRIVQSYLGKRIPTFTAPLPFLAAVAAMMQLLTNGRSPLHPMRVRKAALSTHIVPETLAKFGFDFHYDFAASLKDWATQRPTDFS